MSDSTKDKKAKDRTGQQTSETSSIPMDPESTVTLASDLLEITVRDEAGPQDSSKFRYHEGPHAHLKGLLEALIFASDKPIKISDLAKFGSAPSKEVKELLALLQAEYHGRGILLEEVAGGWTFRTNAAYAPFVRDLTQRKPVKLTRAQIETLAILAYRQPITRPEIDEIRGVDSGPVLKLLLERDLIRILGKKDEPGRPILYGTTPQFLEFFGLKSLKDLPTLREFTELTEDSRRVVEKELGDVLEATQPHDLRPSLEDMATVSYGEEADDIVSEPYKSSDEEPTDADHTEPRAVDVGEIDADEENDEEEDHNWDDDDDEEKES